MRIIVKFWQWSFLALAIASSACSGLRTRYHEVETGDTLAKIATSYDVPLVALKNHNGEKLSAGLKVGSKLYIPFEDSANWNATAGAENLDDSSPTADAASRDISAVHFSWPVSGVISSPFGKRRNERHEGIDIAAKKGTVVKASRSGHVIYSSNQISGYGNMIIVKHSDSFSTVYAHLSKFDVRKGQFVTRGQKIGLVGRTGRATGSHLHFEIRNDRVAVNPLLYLQGQYATNTIR
jgi:murein DD-endopeptidase MepM/ murein hydrolase activator NlpD